MHNMLFILVTSPFLTVKHWLGHASNQRRISRTSQSSSMCLCVPKTNSSKSISAFCVWILGAGFPLINDTQYHPRSHGHIYKTDLNFVVLPVNWRVHGECYGSFSTYFFPHVTTERARNYTSHYYAVLKRNAYKFCFSVLASSAEWTVQVIWTTVWQTRNHSSTKTVQIQ